MENSVVTLEQTVQPTEILYSVPREGSSFICMEDYLKINSLDAVTSALSLDMVGIKTIPTKPNSGEPYSKSDAYSVGNVDVSKIKDLYVGKNLDIVIGVQSRNLFALKCRSWDSFIIMCSRIREDVQWVIKSNDNYFILLHLKCGQMKNSIGITPDYEIWGEEKTVPIPPSIIGLEGPVWLMKNGDQPPSVSKARISRLFPIAKFISFRNTPTCEKPTQKLNNLKVLQYYLWGQRHKWPSCSISARKVFDALCQRANLEDPKCFRATVRELAELAPVSDATAQKMIQKFIAWKIIRFVKRANQANYYGFQVKLPENVSPEAQELENSPLQVFRTNSEAYVSGALNYSGEIILDELRKGSCPSIKGLAKRCNLARDTVRKGLKKLQVEYLVEYKAETGYQIAFIGCNRFDEIAEKYQTKGFFQRKVDAHKRQREAYHIKRLRWSIPSFEI